MESHLVAGAPASPLRRHVDAYWGYAERAPGPVRQREPASTGVVLIFGLGPELKVLDAARPDRPPTRVYSFVAGLDDTCALIEHDGEMRGVQVDLSPIAARMIFGVPMHELARQVVHLDDALGREARRLDEQLADARTWPERFSILDEALARRLADAEPPPPDVEWAWRLLREARGRIRVSELAAELGCSRKHLAVRFRDHVGLPPKLVARILRFRHAGDLLTSSDRGLDEIVHRCGYYDQAHLDRDFREFARTTPTAYRADARARVTFVQATASTVP